MLGCGPETSYIQLRNDATAGDTVITVDSVPTGWVAGMQGNCDENGIEAVLV